MASVAESDLDLATFRLASGSHRDLAHGACVMELVSYVAREPWGDHPQCVSPAIGTFLRSWNDTLDDDTRQRLKPYVEKVIGTNTGPADEDARAWLAIDWLVRTFAPAWLDAANLQEHASKLRGLPALTTSELANEASEVIHAAGDAAGDAAWAAARDAAWDAAGDAARDAAWAAARAAARDALQPTVLMLQDSAFGLLDSMIAVGKVEVAA